MNKIVILFAITFVCAIPSTSIAQDTRPTLKETLEWIKTKVNAYGEGHMSTDPKISVNDRYQIIYHKQTHGWDENEYEEKSLSLYDVTSFYMTPNPSTIGECNYFTLYSKDKNVRIYEKSKKYTGTYETSTSFSTQFSTYFRFCTSSYTEAEENLNERFRKALETLVYYNTKDRPKEAF